MVERRLWQFDRGFMLLRVVHSVDSHIVRLKKNSIAIYGFTHTVVPREFRNSQFHLSFAQLFLNSMENDLQ